MTQDIQIGDLVRWPSEPDVIYRVVEIAGDVVSFQRTRFFRGRVQDEFTDVLTGWELVEKGANP